MAMQSALGGTVKENSTHWEAKECYSNLTISSMDPCMLSIPEPLLEAVEDIYVAPKRIGVGMGIKANGSILSMCTEMK